MIQRKLNKRRKIKKTSKILYYQNELENFFKSKKSFEQQVPTKTDDLINNEKTENVALTLRITKTDKELLDLKELKDYLNAYKKLVAVRCQHNGIPLNETKIDCMNALVLQVETRRSKVELERQNLKEEIKSSNFTKSNSKKASHRYRLNELLTKTENQIKQNLFSQNDESMPMTNQELFQRQSEISIDKLVLIRQEWDHFISNSVHSESIPIEWVIPSSEPNESSEWNKFIVPN